MKNFYFLIIALLIFSCKPGFSQEKEGDAIKKMHASAELTVQWLKKHVKISRGQADELLKILNVPAETFKEIGNVIKENPDSLQTMQSDIAAKMKQDIENVFTPKQLAKFNSKKEEFNKWLVKKLKERGY